MPTSGRICLLGRKKVGAVFFLFFYYSSTIDDLKMKILCNNMINELISNFEGIIMKCGK
jgi:hypothetical protein